MVTIIEDKQLLFNIGYNIAIIPIYIDKKIICIYVLDIDTKNFYIIPINTFDCLNLKYNDVSDFLKNKKIITLDKKRFIKFFKDCQNVIDINIFMMFTNNRDFFNNNKKFNNKTFVITDCEYYLDLLKNMINYFNRYEINLENFKIYNDDFVYVFNKIEQNKIFCDGNYYDLNHNLLNNAGRVSATGRINFMNLRKNSPIKDKICSRFGDDGILVSVDYNACVMYMCADIIGYSFEKYPYEYFNEVLYNNELEISEVKKLCYTAINGNLKIEHEFFKKLDDFKKHLEMYYNKYEVLVSPFANKPIQVPDKKNIFSYFLQSYESEMIILNIKKLLDIIEKNNYKSKIILYIYDSILIDFNFEDKELLTHISSIFENNKYKIKIKAGVNYNNMEIYE